MKICFIFNDESLAGFASVSYSRIPTAYGKNSSSLLMVSDLHIYFMLSSLELKSFSFIIAVEMWSFSLAFSEFICP